MTHRGRVSVREIKKEVETEKKEQRETETDKRWQEEQRNERGDTERDPEGWRERVR